MRPPPIETLELFEKEIAVPSFVIVKKKLRRAVQQFVLLSEICDKVGIFELWKQLGCNGIVIEIILSDNNPKECQPVKEPFKWSNSRVRLVDSWWCC